MVYVLLADGFEEIEALTPVDVFRRLGVSVTLVGITGEYVTGSHGITVKADVYSTDNFAELTEKNQTECVIFPGGMPGASNLDSSRDIDIFLSAAERDGAYIAAICAAPMILGKRNLLAGKRATCYPGFEKYLAGATVVDEGAVCDGKIVTGRSMAAALEFSLLLASKLKGDSAVDEIRSAVIAK